MIGTSGEPTIGGLFAVNASGPRRFTAGAARDLLLAERRTAFADRFVDPLLVEARKLGLGADDLSRLILDRAATADAVLASSDRRRAEASVTTEGTSR
jgi:hypothetical protein